MMVYENKDCYDITASYGHSISFLRKYQYVEKFTNLLETKAFSGAPSIYITFIKT